MSEPKLDPAAAADALLARTVAAITAGATPGAQSVGRSARERVTATLAGDGTVHVLELDPRALRATAGALAAEIVEAVNAAVDARPAATGTSRTDDLRALQEGTLVQARAMRTALEGELNRLVDGAREER